MTADEYVSEVRSRLVLLADPMAAPKMSAYMKHVAPFLGVAAPVRRAAVREMTVLNPGNPLNPDDIHAVATLLFAQPEREFAYVATELVDREVRQNPQPAHLELIVSLALTNSWWDTVDGLFHSVGRLVVAFPQLESVVEGWLTHDDFWLARMAILQQNGMKDATDLDRLSRACLGRAADKQFFIRKAIGWALRDLAWTNPAWVNDFTNQHAQFFSPLTLREARKNLNHPKLQPPKTSVG